MKIIDLLDKRFEFYISENEIDTAVDKVAKKINSDYKNIQNPLFITVMNGAFMFTSDLMKKIELDAELSFIKVSSYAGLCSSGEISETIGLNVDVNGRDVIILDEMVDSGKTIDYIHEMLTSKGAKSVKTCCLIYKTCTFKGKTNIDYYGLLLEKDLFIVGYGLDYNQHGRQLKDIYILHT